MADAELLRFCQVRIQRALYLTRNAVKAVFMQANSARVLENAERKIIPAGVGRRHLFSYSSSGVLHRWAKCAQEFSDVAAVVKKDRI